MLEKSWAKFFEKFEEFRPRFSREIHEKFTRNRRGRSPPTPSPLGGTANRCGGGQCVRDRHLDAVTGTVIDAVIGTVIVAVIGAVIGAMIVTVIDAVIGAVTGTVIDAVIGTVIGTVVAPGKHGPFPPPPQLERRRRRRRRRRRAGL